MMYTPYPMKIIQEPNWVTFIFEGGAHVWRQIPIAPRGFLLSPAARQHQPDLPGRFRSAGMKATRWSSTPWASTPARAARLSPAIRMANGLHVIGALHAPGYADAWSTLRRSKIPSSTRSPGPVRITTGYQPAGKMLEYICQENESDSKHLLDDLREARYRSGQDPVNGSSDGNAKVIAFGRSLFYFR